MNALSSTAVYHYEIQEDDIPESADLLEKTGLVMIVAFPSVALAISALSAVHLLTGVTDCGGPLGHIMNIFISSGLI